MNKKFLGIFLATISSTLWGIGGNFTGYIFKNSNIDYSSLVFFRMFIASIIFFILGFIKDEPIKAFDMINNKKRFIQLIIYSFFGMLGVQLPFYATIKYSSAPFATLMQFGAPILVILYICFKYRKKPQLNEIICTFFILIGVFFVVTNGKLNSLSVQVNAIYWGLITAFGYAFYIVYAKNFFSWPTSFLMAYGMLFGSIFILPITNFKISISCLSQTNILFSFIMVLTVGTVIPFYLLIESSRYINPKLTCMLSVAEPIVSLFVSIIFMNEHFGLYQFIGILIIIFSIFVVTSTTKD